MKINRISLANLTIYLQKFKRKIVASNICCNLHVLTKKSNKADFASFEVVLGYPMDNNSRIVEL